MNASYLSFRPVLIFLKYNKIPCSRSDAFLKAVEETQGSPENQNEINSKVAHDELLDLRHYLFRSRTPTTIGTQSIETQSMTNRLVLQGRERNRKKGREGRGRERGEGGRSFKYKNTIV